MSIAAPSNENFMFFPNVQSNTEAVHSLTYSISSHFTPVPFALPLNQPPPPPPPLHQPILAPPLFNLCIVSLQLSPFSQSLIMVAIAWCLLAGNARLDGEGKEIKHFNYSRLVGGASYRRQSCNKDR